MSQEQKPHVNSRHRRSHPLTMPLPPPPAPPSSSSSSSRKNPTSDMDMDRLSASFSKTSIALPSTSKQRQQKQQPGEERKALNTSMMSIEEGAAEEEEEELNVQNMSVVEEEAGKLTITPSPIKPRKNAIVIQGASSSSKSPPSASKQGSVAKPRPLIQDERENVERRNAVLPLIAKDPGWKDTFDYDAARYRECTDCGTRGLVFWDLVERKGVYKCRLSCAMNGW